jgi:hypothetical protein
MDRAKCFFDTTGPLAHSGARAREEIYGPPCDKIGLTEKLGDAYTSSTGYLISCMSISVSNILSMNR